MYVARLGVGVNSVLSKKLGEGDKQGVNRAAGNGMLLIWLVSVAFVFIGLFAMEPFYRMQTDIAEVLDMSISYSEIISVLAFAALHQVMMERFLSATGKANLTMVSMLVGAVGFWMNLHFNKEVRFERKGFLPDGSMIAEIIKVGVPVALSQCLISVLAFGMNNILLSLSAVAPGIYVIYIRLKSFVIMPAGGMSTAGISIIAYNFGAGNGQLYHCSVTGGIPAAFRMAVIFIGQCSFSVAGVPNHGNPPVFYRSVHGQENIQKADRSNLVNHKNKFLEGFHDEK